MDRIRWCDIFRVGAKINVGYTRFPRELVICTGVILKVDEESQILRVAYLNGLGGTWNVSFRDAFKLNYQERPLYNPPKEEN